MKTKTKWEKIGVITVDAGIVQVGDPCYNFTDEHDKWVSYLDETGIMTMKESSLQLNHKAGATGKAIIVHSGYGDGIYEVEAKKEDGRIKEIRIRFF